MAHIRAICTDVDGTLLGPSHELRDDTREALQAAVARGIKVVLCTGRGSGKWITDIREQVGGGNSIGAPAVLRHGRLVIGTDEALLRRTTVQNEVVQALKPIMPERMIAHSVCGQTFARTYHQEVRDTIAPFGDHYWTVVGDTVFDSIGAEAAAAGTEAVEAYGLEYVLVGLDDAVIASVRAQVEAAVAHLDVVTLSAVKGFIEITAGAKVSKASALQEVLPLVGVEAHEVIALGDGENDLEMLAMVRDAGGISVAMGNAVPAVKECAEHQTTANSEGGWHRALQEHVLAAPRVAES
eukprot:Rhum_TRINITY_DN20755_c0_g1::Rhum_TRINITY_DN20755_c0_g1_i1::g.172041::m.172041